MRPAWRVGTMKWGSSLKYYLTSSVDRSCVAGTPMSTSSAQKSRSSTLVISERRTGESSMASEKIRGTVGCPLEFLNYWDDVSSRAGVCSDALLLVRAISEHGPKSESTRARSGEPRDSAERHAASVGDSVQVGLLRILKTGGRARGNCRYLQNCGAKLGERKTVARRLRSRLRLRVCVIPA